MKYILMLIVMFALVIVSSAAVTRAPAVKGAGIMAADIEGVTIERQRAARLKPGYAFRRESKNSLAVLKTIGGAALQMGTLSCVKKKGTCNAEFSGDYAKCSSGCYFVGVRGGVNSQ